MIDQIKRLLLVICASLCVIGCATTQSVQTTNFDLKINIWSLQLLPQELQKNIQDVLVLENTRGTFHQKFSPTFGKILRNGADTEENLSCKDIQERRLGKVNVGAWKRDITKRVVIVTYLSDNYREKSEEIEVIDGIACISFKEPTNVSVRLKGDQTDVLSPTKSKGFVEVKTTDWERRDPILSVHLLMK